jgi:protein TonB
MLLVAEGPVYPEFARVQQLDGFVTLGYDVTVSGNVVNVRVINSEPVGVFDNAAIEAVRDWQFLPMQLNGTPVPADRQVSTLTFKLSADEQDAAETSASNTDR